MNTNETHTICSHCSVGCNINLTSKGNLLVRALPEPNSKVDDGLLCVKGRFGFDVAQKYKINTTAYKKKWKIRRSHMARSAVIYYEKAQSLSVQNGSNALAVSVSDRYTNEEIYLVSEYAKNLLKTDHICSFNSIHSGIKDVLGYDASSNTLEELLSTNVILLVGSDVIKDHTIAGLKIRKAVENGAKLIVINPCFSQADEWAYKTIRPENTVLFLKEILKALIDSGFAPKAETDLKL